MGEWLQQGWRPALEIWILTVGIYYGVLFVRGTRGAPVVTGFLVFLVCFGFVAQALQLQVLNWLLREFLAFFVIAVLIIFQPELRRLLALLGDQSFLYTAYEKRENLEVVVQAAVRLSEVRIGALIAIEQNNELKEIVEVGVPVDCDATPEMLETIFFPNNAIHDGGVILNGDRIAYAACIFPLTQRRDLSASMGTRHRAAIGLSEESDAVVVTVSEETGAISYAYKGYLVRGVTEEELRSFLTSVFVPRSEPRKFWKRFGIKKNTKSDSKNKSGMASESEAEKHKSRN